MKKASPKINLGSKKLLVVALGSAMILSACGKRRPPIPPTQQTLTQTRLSGFQRGASILLQISPSSGTRFNQIDVYRLAESADSPLFLTEEEFATRSTLVGSAFPADTNQAISFTDSINLSGFKRRLRYAVRFVNAEGQRSGFSNFYLIEPAANISAIPILDKFTVSQKAVTLQWSAPEKNLDGSTPANVLGFNIYRTQIDRAGKTQPAVQLNSAPINGNVYDDTNFQFGEEYSYFVRAVSAGVEGAQVESESSNNLKVAPRDTFPPAPPEGLTIAAAPGRLSLFFAANLETDVVGYNVYRTIDNKQPPEKWQRLTAKPVSATTFQDAEVEAGRKYFYFLTAVDIAGNESKPSEIVTETVP